MTAHSTARPARPSSDAIFGLAGNDTLNGLAGDDRLHGGSGNDALNGGDGNDYLDGGSGYDAMTGGAGDDTYVIDDVTGTNRDQVTEAATGGGTDTVTGNVNLDLANYANVENINLTGNSDVSATGNAGDNVITGNTGDNTLGGLAGNDTYRFALNGGDDVINETGGTADRITILAAGGALTGLGFSDNNTGTTNGDLVVSINGNNNAITATNHFDGGNNVIRADQFRQRLIRGLPVRNRRLHDQRGGSSQQWLTVCQGRVGDRGLEQQPPRR